MNKRLHFALLLTLFVIQVYSPMVQAQDTGMPQDKVALRYRIERLDKDKWKPIEEKKTFKRNQTVRFRFMGNISGTLYVLNSSGDKASLHPVFAEGEGNDLRRHLGMGTHIEANQVGLFPRPDKGGGLRFTGVKGKERFLFIYIPDVLDKQRAMMAIVPGAEGWDFDAKTTYMVTGEVGKILFHYFELKSK